MMNLTKIELSALPDLQTLTGVFGSGAESFAVDDSVVILATFVFEMSG